jgi:flagellar biosynthesis regulator FlbT
MSENYIEFRDQVMKMIDDFRNSLIVTDFNNEDTLNFHKQWFNHIITNKKRLDNMEDDLINERKKR